MAKYIINRDAFMKALLPPTEQYIRSVIKETDTNAVMTYLPATDEYVLECKGKPRDLPMFGVYWEEVPNPE